MTFILVLILMLMLFVAAALLVQPLMRRFTESSSAAAFDAALFKEQMKELEREAGHGILSKDEKEATKRDIERQALIAVNMARGWSMSGSKDNVRIIGIALTIGWLTIGSALLYYLVGRPDLADLNTTSRLIAAPEPTQTAPLASRAVQAAGQPKLSDVDTMIRSLAARLEKEPNDIKGWRMLAWSYLKTQNYQSAVDAFARVVELAPNDDEAMSLYGEAVTRANGGVVGPRAQKIFDRSLQLNPGNIRSAYFTGVALEQSGQSEAALETWLDILERMPRDAKVLPDIVARIRQVAADINYDISDRPSLTQKLPPLPQTLVGPTEDEISAAKKMSEEERQAMILSMVDGLAQRLMVAPDDSDGWARLIRSYVVLGDRTGASRALTQAREVFAQNEETLDYINGVASALGLN